MQHVITPGPINDYAEQYSTPEPEVLASLNRETHATVRGAQMISGHLQGVVLEMLSYMVKPKLVLELGTYTGYSAIALSRGLQPGGKLHTVDIDPYLQDMRDRYWLQAGVKDKIVQHLGNAADVVPKIQGRFDLVFLDADKKSYGTYFDMLIDRVEPGGFIIADNVLFHGEVILPVEQQSNAAAHMHNFNKKIAEDRRVEQVIMPLRDGLMLIRKI
ncbi:MAG: O-methyltransferase [Edaphocola sp.]